MDSSDEELVEHTELRLAGVIVDCHFCYGHGKAWLKSEVWCPTCNGSGIEYVKIQPLKWNNNSGG